MAIKALTLNITSGYRQCFLDGATRYYRILPYYDKRAREITEASLDETTNINDRLGEIGIIDNYLFNKINKYHYNATKRFRRIQRLYKMVIKWICKYGQVATQRTPRLDFIKSRNDEIGTFSSNYTESTSTVIARQFIAEAIHKDIKLQNDSSDFTESNTKIVEFFYDSTEYSDKMDLVNGLPRLDFVKPRNDE